MKNFTSGKEYANINKVNALLTQLVECLLDVEKVSGSSPLQRTKKQPRIFLCEVIFLYVTVLANR